MPSSSLRFPKECDSKRIEAVHVYAPKLAYPLPVPAIVGRSRRKGTSTAAAAAAAAAGRKIHVRLYHVLFVVLYMVQLYFVVSSIGQPYYEFLLKAEQEGLDVMAGTNQLRAEFEYALGDIHDPKRRIKKIGWMDWTEMDIEELAEAKKKDREQSVLDSLSYKERVPSKYAASFWSSLLLGVWATLHCLVLLLQHWLVSFHVWMQYKEVDVQTVLLPDSVTELPDTDEQAADPTTGSTAAGNTATIHANNIDSIMEADPYRIPTDTVIKKASTHAAAAPIPTHARIVPAKGKHILVPLEYYPTLGITFTYHRRKYVYDPQTTLWHKIRCRTDIPLHVFSNWQGLCSSTGDQSTIIKSQIKHGYNFFQVKQPNFMDLYKKQLLNPFTVFQLFCVLLWAIDDYLIYSFFSLFMVLMFEGTVVFQRLKSLQALRSMGNKIRNHYVYRNQTWIVINSLQLLPGDIISLTRVKPKKVSTTVASGNNNPKLPKITKIEDEGGDVVPADLLLLQGSTVVNEASLTGESVPQMKEGLVLEESTKNETTNTTKIPKKKKNKKKKKQEQDDEDDDDEDAEDENKLDMKNRHKMNVVYAGTTMLQCKGGSTSTNNNNNNTTKFHIPNPPDNGCICFVLRTGFSSAQGKLVRMIEGSQEKVKGHEKETGLLLALLFIFAISSSSYVLYQGIYNDKQSGKRSKYELLLHCILIVTSVVRPELPMQMALAVNNSLMTLMKLHVFCTEPYRVPMAGKLDICLFDKTGTLTTDELVAVGVYKDTNPTTTTTAAATTSEETTTTTSRSTNNNTNKLTPMNQIHNEAALVIAGCHSLVVYEEETTGDPLESASLRSIRWEVQKQHDEQDDDDDDPAKISQSPTSSSTFVIPSVATEKKPAGKAISVTTSTTTDITSIEILTRHHFSSKLQRMSCVIKANNKQYYSVAKGSPEAIGKLLVSNKNNKDYDTISKSLSKEGYRVIALAYKQLNADQIETAKQSRTICEENLSFAGFIAFTCRVRKDTSFVLNRLKEGGMKVIMVTGDALLTAIHVAKEVDICEPVHGKNTTTTTTNGTTTLPKSILEQETNEELRKLLESKQANKQTKDKRNSSKNDNVKIYRPILYLEEETLKEENNDNKREEDNVDVEEEEKRVIDLVWKSYEDSSVVKKYVAKDIPELSKKYELAMTGKSLDLALSYDKVYTKQVLQYIKVFARMSPDLKETVIESLHSVSQTCMMCGDGANDVGALKQADVGVALLTGFGNVNVDSNTNATDDDKKDKNKQNNDTPKVTAIMSKQQLEELKVLPVRLLKMKIRSLGVNPDNYPDLVEKDDLIQLYQIKARELAIKKHEKKNAMDKAKMTKAEAAADKNRRMMQRIQELEAQGVQWAQFQAMREFWNEEMEQARLQKAALAQGRSIEGSAAQMAAQLDNAELDSMELPMVKLGDASIAAPFTSKMPSIRNCVDIVRQGRCTLVSSIQMYQILALQSLISSYSLSVLYLDGVKYGDTQMTALGLLGSVSFMSVSRSKPLDKLSSVRPLTSIFHPALFVSLLGQFVIHLSTMILAVMEAKRHLPQDYDPELDGVFKPGILNTVVFLVSSVQQVTVFIVNLQGRPFMTGVLDNRPLLWSLIATFILTFMFASESVPGLNKYFQLVPFPEDSMRDYILILLSMDLVATYVLDIICKFVFANEILVASMKDISFNDLWKLARTFGVIAFLMYQFLGNDDSWEELIRMESEMMGMNETSSSSVMEPVVLSANNETIRTIADEL